MRGVWIRTVFTRAGLRHRRDRCAAGLALAMTVAFLTASCRDEQSVAPATNTVVRHDDSIPGPPPGKGGPPDGGSARGAGRGLAEHPEELSLPAPSVRMLWVAASGTDGGDGSEARPWNDLDAALRQLAPGDRLVLKPGNYRGPFVIDGSFPQGTAETPIEVHARVDAVLRGTDERPVLTVRQHGWTLYGLEIEPGTRSGPALVVEGARDLRVIRGHFHDGGSDGVRIEPGSENVTIENTHIHVFGPRGGPPDRRRPVVGVLIAPDTRDVGILGCNVHNISGTPVKILSPEDYGPGPDGSLLPAARGVRVEETTQLTNWPEKD